MGYKILTINPGSTSTKVALFDDDQVLFSQNVSHAAEELAKYKELMDQLPYRKETILEALKDVKLDKLDAVVGRGGGLLPLEGGTYEIDETILEHSTTSKNGVVHPANLGPSLAKQFANEYNARAFVVNPPDTDELQPVARVTGVKDVYRTVHLHALNLKETAIRHADSIGKKYEECNFIVCHIGGGVSVSAHKLGKMVDGNDIVGGEGPMAPTRCGSLPASGLINLCFSSIDKKQAKSLCTRTGGFVSHLGTSDAREVTQRIKDGDKMAELVWETFKYQIVKDIGAMSTVLGGKVDGILLGGGIVHDKGLVEYINENCSWIAPVTAYPGEFEMEAMASGATRVLHGVEELKVYTGKPIWNGFDF